ncbi:MAG: DUF362 domain-containing protein [Promethearchaeota archaeon]|nr:MAG: DUF362 domain-containing protein [Candidatus Lokiarchaeota archaeon]
MDQATKPIVSLAKNKNISQAVKSCLDNIKIPDLTGKNVLLKPNVGREVDPKLAINTNPEVVEAIFEYLKQKFDATYLIGDSPIINTDTRKAFEQSGYKTLLKQENLFFIDLDDKPPTVLKIPNGRIIKEIKVSGYFNKIDYIISIPVLKMHMHTGASLSFKNMKGMIYKREKITLHHLQAPEIIKLYKNPKKEVKELDFAIADLAHVIKPDLAIIDASYVLEGMGPSSGNPVKLDTIIASDNFLAADIIALAITQPKWDLNYVPHLKLISELNSIYPKGIDDIKTIPKDIGRFIKPLEPPPTSITIKYKNVNLIDIDSCSACLSTIFNLLKHNKDFIDEHFTPEKPLNIAIGKGIKPSDLYSDTFLIGNCTYEQRENGIFIKGCTPVESTILDIIKKNVEKEKK